LEELGVHGTKTIKMELTDMVLWCELDLGGSGLGSVAGCYKNSNESSVFVKCRELLDWLNVQ
jgi:hypothetical protein